MKKQIKKFIFITMILFLVLIGIVFALEDKLCEKKVEFYYSPSCPHCQEVFPLVNELKEYFTNWNFYFYDVTQKSYPDINAVPLIIIKPGDGRTIELIGTYEIQKYLKCEVQEQSTPECLTHYDLVRESYFLE